MFFHCWILFFASGLSLFGQQAAEQSSDSVRSNARTLVKQKQPDQALQLLRDYLLQHPTDSDSRVLLGLICSWENRYGEGREQLELVLNPDPDYKDAVLALVNLEIWDGNPGRAEDLAAAAVKRRPGDEDYQAALKKASSKKADGEKEKLTEKTPAEPSVNWETGFGSSQIFYSDKRSPWREETYNIAGHTGAGWITARLSHANQYGYSSNLWELESYPSIRPGTYGYLNMGFSPDGTLYAHRRFGAEIFQSLPSGFEGSAGMRYLRFNQNVNVFTASLGKWFGNNWVDVRTFIVPGNPGPSRSLQLKARKYFDSPDKFVGVHFGVGAAPVEIVNVNQIGILRSQSYLLETLWTFQHGLRFRAQVGIDRQQRIYGAELLLYNASCSLNYRF